MSEQAKTETAVCTEPVVRRYTVDICDPCRDLDGQECHTPGCIFFLWGMDDVKAFMNRALIAPVIDGERYIVQKGRRV
jgi:hypothetical protein